MLSVPCLPYYLVSQCTKPEKVAYLLWYLARQRGKGSGFLPSFKLFSLSFGNVRKIVYPRALTYCLSFPENTFLLFIPIFLHSSFSFLHWKSISYIWKPYIKSTYFLFSSIILHFTLAESNLCTTFVLFGRGKGGKPDLPDLTCSKCLHFPDLWSYDTNVSTC